MPRILGFKVAVSEGFYDTMLTPEAKARADAELAAWYAAEAEVEALEEFIEVEQQLRMPG